MSHVDDMRGDRMNDSISRRAVELRINEFFTNETYTEEMLRNDIHNLPSAQPEPDHFRETSKMIWHECDPDDPSSFPDDGKLVLMSFSNFPTPAIGWFERANDGGYWTDGNQRTLAELGLYVDGWWELPKKPEAKMELTEP
jgi:hypothetical protein